MSKEQHILVTGGAGFIGSHLVDRLLATGYKVTCVDNLDNFYSRERKLANIQAALSHPRYRLCELDIRRQDSYRELHEEYTAVIHLAAKAGVLPSIKDPAAYAENNILGTQLMLDFARNRSIQKFVFASSSSVYGVNTNTPWRETDMVLKPISPYAASKVSGELLGQVYNKLFDMQFLSLRFFTVFGPRQRPDLAIHKFVRMIDEGMPIPVYGDGNSLRDYTYIADIVTGIVACLSYTETGHEIFNLGNNKPVSLTELIATIERVMDKEAILNRLPEQMGDVPVTYADIDKASRLLNYKTATGLEQGISEFYKWFKTNKIQELS